MRIFLVQFLGNCLFVIFLSCIYSILYNFWARIKIVVVVVVLVLERCLYGKVRLYRKCWLF